MSNALLKAKLKVLTEMGLQGVNNISIRGAAVVRKEVALYRIDTAADVIQVGTKTSDYASLQYQAELDGAVYNVTGLGCALSELHEVEELKQLRESPHLLLSLCKHE